MSTVGQIERATQNRIVHLLRDELGYRYLGNWIDREKNANIETELLSAWLRDRGVSETLIGKALHKFGQAAALGAGKSLYEINRVVYEMLRYGVKVKEGAGQHNQTVHLIDWQNPEANDFAVAEEVTVDGHHTKRPDVVLYVNGIALGVVELKRSTVSLGEGIRQNLVNQKREFIQSFFTTMQLVMAGNDTEGLRYGTIETPEKYYLRWREENPAYEMGDPKKEKYLPNGSCAGGSGVLDCELLRLLKKERFLELIHDFIVFDAGVKKVCRHNQFFGVQAARENVWKRDDGIIWHTQGSGKSLTMVWLAKWIRENVTDGRVLIVTDRTELDQQIEQVFYGVNEEIYRTESGADLIGVLNETNPWLLCSLVHKFGQGEGEATDKYIEELRNSLPAGFKAKGELFVFVDEAHRTQSGKLHTAMKAVLPEATFFGFTGTPLLKSDKARTIEVFGPYIHTYKFDEGVRDGVILDLRYEARDIDQEITSPKRIDAWFEARTRALSDVAKSQLKQKWGTMQKVHSSEPRLKQIVADIQLDMATRDRLMSGRGNAMLVAGSIYEACRYYELFSRTDLEGKCAVVTSYEPTVSDITGEESGEGKTEKVLKYDAYRKMLADHFDQPEEQAMKRVEEFERDVKKQFVESPGQMKLLIVVDKLLTGFDAPPATYLYIDKSMRDHGLFQAICRVNRLDGDDKEYGYIIDYQDLFQSLEGAISDYTGGALEGYDKEDVEGLLEDRLEKAREDLEAAREQVHALCEPVDPPKETPQYLHYFCAEDTSDKDAVAENAPKRAALYKHVGSLVRAFAAIANEMEEAGYSSADRETIREEVSHYETVRKEVKLSSGDYIDMKMYEPAMRHLLDTYIKAEDSEKISAFDDLGLVELIVEKGAQATEELPEGIRNSQEAMAETIENNVRRVIIDEQATNPKYYEQMSKLLDALIQQRRKKALDYKAYLQEIVELSKKVLRPQDSGGYPPSIDTPEKQALYDNTGEDEELALELDKAIRSAKKDDWVGDTMKERYMAGRIYERMKDWEVDIDEVVELAKNQDAYR